MKILHLIYSHAVSGAEKYLQHLLPGLSEYGIDCHLMVVSNIESAEKFGRYCDALNLKGIKATLLVANKGAIVFTARKINKYLKKNDIKIIHSHLLNSDLIACLIKILFNRKIYLISTKHGYQETVLQQYEPDRFKIPRNLYYYITKFTLKKINKNIAVSEALSDLYFNIKLTKLHFPYIHHGVKIENIIKETDGGNFKNALPQLIIVGRIEKFKGHRFLIEAMEPIVKVYPGIKLLVLGEGSEKDICIQQVRALQLQDNIEFLGYQTMPYSYISNSDVIILPSLFEPFGLVYIEALALKIPIVAFDTPAGNEILQNNETALLVKKEDSGALAEQIIYLLRNRGERDGLAQRGYAKYQDSYTTEIMIKNTAEWYFNNVIL